MAENQPPTPAYRRGFGGALTAWPPRDLVKRGYIPTWPDRAVVPGVAGVPSDATVPLGTTHAVDTTTGLLYRKSGDAWLNVSGNPEGIWR